MCYQIYYIYFCKKKDPKKGTIRTDRNFPNGAFFWCLFLHFGDFFLTIKIQYYKAFIVSIYIVIYTSRLNEKYAKFAKIQKKAPLERFFYKKFFEISFWT